jgi:catechol 2,3-dioxygenase-like lactoylglutathione lyase family enzyme
MPSLSFNQIALNTVDIAASLRFYTEVFGFLNAGSQVGWGEVMNVQGLDPAGQTVVWWMVGRHPRIQFEIFHHTGPLLRRQRDDWSPADHGWVRYGIAMRDFDGVRARLAERGIVPLGGVAAFGDSRRFAIRDPFCGIVIEVWEDCAGLPRGTPQDAHDCDPLILYVTSSVSDIEAARRYYTDILRLPTVPLDRLHGAADEAVWGLPGAQREGFLVEAVNGFVEVVEYRSPRGRPRRDDHRLSDQGIMNVGFYAPETEKVQGVIDRLDAQGAGPKWLTVGEDLLGIYINEADREVELLACPEAVRGELGFRPVGQFGGGDFIKMVPRNV